MKLTTIATMWNKDTAPQAMLKFCLKYDRRNLLEQWTVDELLRSLSKASEENRLAVVRDGDELKCVLEFTTNNKKELYINQIFTDGTKGVMEKALLHFFNNMANKDTGWVVTGNRKFRGRTIAYPITRLLNKLTLA